MEHTLPGKDTERMMLNPDSFKHINILVLGDVMLDRYLSGDVHRVSPEAPVPVLSVRDRKEVLGGAGNVAANLAALGCSVTLMGVIGRDYEGERITKLLAEKGIGRCLIETEDRPTTTKTRVIGGNQQIVRFDEETAEVVSPGTEEMLSTAMFRLLDSAKGVLLSDYGKGVLKGNLCKSVISGALRRGLPVFVDPKGRDWERYRGATCVTPNEAEFFAVSGESTDERGFFSRNALEIKSRFEINNLLVTRGAKGIAFFPEEGDPCFAPAPRVREVYDVSGAGDTVVAVLAASVVSGYSWDYGVSLANRAAGIVITRVGTSPVSMEDLSGPVEEDSKICTWAEAERRVALWKKNGASVVFTNGCFDLLHPGHIKVLRQAAREGDRLVVGLNSDASIRRLKGPDRPVLPQADRASILAALDCVDLVVVFEEDTPENLIRLLIPSVLVKGGDYTPESVVGRQIVEEGGGRVVIVPLMEGKSTSKILLSFKKR